MGQLELMQMTTQPKGRPYYWLVCRESDGKWYPQFGDYVYGVVLQERKDTYQREYSLRNIQILRGSDRTEWIQNWLKLNNEG
jgi:hypothetical protein